MPVLKLTNNQLLPANQRASDVAASAVEGIADVQQQRINAAFHVQGVQALIYHRLSNGRKCSCQSHMHKLSARLNTDGTADPGLINQLLTGVQFGTTEYKPSKDIDSDFNIHYSGEDPSSSDLPRMWNLAQPNPQQEQVGDNGISNPDTLLQDYNGFDPSSMMFGDTACPLCYGTGYIGGYALYNGHRIVVPVEDMDLTAHGILNPDVYPFTAETDSIVFPLVIPKGIVSVDCFKVCNKWDTVPAVITIDDQKISQQVIKAKADGRIHKVSAKFNSIQVITHFEFQANQSVKSAYIELPKLSKSSRIDIFDSSDDFQILLSPDIPHIEKRDIIVDCMHGKTLYVQNSTWLNTRQRQMLGWEINVRVVQPVEAFIHLPHRKVRTRNQTVNPVIGNIGNRP